LHYYLTNMSEELRPYVRMDGKKLVSYDLGTSQCVFIWLNLREYIQKMRFTPDLLCAQADSILSTVSHCNKGEIPTYLTEGIAALKDKLNSGTLDEEMDQLRRLLETDFYADIMETINWKKKDNGEYDRKSFKSDVLFAFLYGENLTWKKNKMMQYFIGKFPAIYCVLWKKRQLSEVCRMYYRLKDRERICHYDAREIVVTAYNMAEFPKDMQRREADIFYNVICPQVEQPFVTIHDSIIVQNGIKCNVKQIMEQAFQDRFGIHVHIKREPWC